LSDLLGRLRYPLTYMALAVACILSIVSGKWPSELNPGSKLLLEVASPLQKMISLPIHQLRGWWDNYVALVQVREEYDVVAAENARLRQEVVQYREAVVASERFARFGDLKARRDVPMVPANVAAQDLSPWFRSITIDQGAGAGVKPGMAVITDRGVVGVVAGVTPNFSRVLLISDAQSRVDSFSQRTRVRGTVRGAPDGSCAVDYVLREDDLRVGDLMLTTGRGGLYPKGLVIGKVSKLDKTGAGLFQNVEVEPVVDFRQLEEVFVILDRREIPGADEFSGDSEELWAGATRPDVGPTTGPALPAKPAEPTPPARARD
jgi:rod shape-determining protein MreC